MHHNIFLIIIIFIILLYKLINEKINENQEHFRLFYESSPSTRNMSYDLRCEPKIPKLNYLFRNSSIQPYYRKKCLELR